jgi:hypothetical protein
MGVYPETPQFGSIEEAQSWAEKYIARDVYFGANPSLKGIHDALDGAASVLRPYGVKLERFHIERMRSKALAYYNRMGQERLTVNGVKQYVRGEMIRGQAQLLIPSKAAEIASRTQRAFEARKAEEIAKFQRYIDRADEEGPKAWNTPEALASYRNQIDNLEATSRWFMASADPSQSARSLMAHEAGHALSHNFGQELAGVSENREGLAAIFTIRLDLHAVQPKDKWMVSQYGATGGKMGQAQNSELWAECTAARACGQWDLIPEPIREAYEETLATITQEDVAAKIKATEERDAAARTAAANKAALSSIRKRLGLH